ncbi:PqiC family protein [Roseobacter sp. HKCCA0434]|uniref:PqiC family protein n=1 Tax=Roseobacter sp. HKCCA0434 TaxID=3079297 RepID=UPI002905ECBD|nr:PqiC family protein [Roseobacter sp. HKCCA0434]
MKRLAAALILATLAACTGGPEPRILLGAPDLPEPAQRETVVRSIELREISLPYYAQGEEIGEIQEDGSVLLRNDILWADLPPRALTLQLAQGLATRLPSTAVAAEPWPLLSQADLRMEVQVAEALGGARGLYRLSGQYFIVAARDGDYERAAPFDIQTPMDGTSLAALSRAQDAAFAELADLMAEDVAAVTAADLAR